jgi:hypothetical protein
MAFLGPIPSILVEAILTCSSGTDLAPEIYNILYPSPFPGLLGWNLQWAGVNVPIDATLLTYSHDRLNTRPIIKVKVR